MIVKSLLVSSDSADIGVVIHRFLPDEGRVGGDKGCVGGDKGHVEGDNRHVRGGRDSSLRTLLRRSYASAPATLCG